MTQQTEHDDRFAKCTMDDFENESFRDTYLAHHDAVVIAPEPDEDGCYTFSWPHGFMSSTPADWGSEYALLWGCMFIYLWEYHSVCASDASQIVGRWVFGEYTAANKNRQANPMPTP